MGVIDLLFFRNGRIPEEEEDGIGPAHQRGGTSYKQVLGY